MQRALISVMALASLAGCDPGDAPPSAAAPFAMTAEGLGDLFKRECVEQRSADWVRAKSTQLTSACGWPFDDSDCYADNDGRVEWRVSTTDSADIRIMMRWPSEDLPEHGPPNRPLTCEVSIDIGTEETLLQVANQVGRELFDVASPVSYSEEDVEGRLDRLWEWHGNQELPALKLRHAPWSDGGFKWQLCFAAFEHAPRSCVVM
jgi:hypothetical protein